MHALALFYGAAAGSDMDLVCCFLLGRKTFSIKQLEIFFTDK